MDKYRIVVDTREQKPLWHKDVIVEKLNVGDYSIEGYQNRFAIERKSPQDLFGTLDGGHKRFKKELQRAANYDYFAIVIDSSFSKCLNKEFTGSYFSKMKGFVIMQIVFTLHVKYGINIWFCSTRTESKQVIKYIMNAYIKKVTTKAK